MITPAEETATPENPSRKWWKEAVVYQIYPRSFKDSNGDGIGDLNGIISELDYIKNLGVDVVWLGPHFDSPNADNGYDIRDYRKVMQEFGTMQDFDALLAGIKSRQMKLILDLVVNHTSDEHVWFAESRKGKENPYRDYYIWRPAKEGKEPNDWVSFFSGAAWKKDESGEYYLHLFAEKQPDLNWDNPKVRREVYDLMKFWLDKGVDGFRMDVIPFISKDPTFPNYPESFDGRSEYVYAAGPKLHDYLQEMNREVLSQYDVMTVGEAFGVTLEQTPLLIDERRHELNMIFHFDVVRLDRGHGWRWKSWTLPDLKAIYARFAKGLDLHSWPTVFLSNHDNPRTVSHFGDDSAQNRVSSAKVLATLLLTQRGTPFIYQGEELGMTNYPFTKISEFDDIEVRNAWKTDVLTHRAEADEFINHLRKTSRDHSRTPMQWDDTPNAGFSAADKPWFAVNPNYREINAKNALTDRDSVYHYFKKLIAFRKHNPALIYGEFEDLDPAHLQLFTYLRTLGPDRLLIILNFSGEPVAYPLPKLFKADDLEFSSSERKAENPGVLNLEGWEARIYHSRG